MEKVIVGVNDLATTHQELAAQWDYERNSITPQDVDVNWPLFVKWRYPYNDPVTGKHFEFTWGERIRTRIDDPTCPFLNGHVWPGFNDFATKFPNIAPLWSDENGDVKPYHEAEDSSWSYDAPYLWQCCFCGKTYTRGILTILKDQACRDCGSIREKELRNVKSALKSRGMVCDISIERDSKLRGMTSLRMEFRFRKKAGVDDNRKFIVLFDGMQRLPLDIWKSFADILQKRQHAAVLLFERYWTSVRRINKRTPAPLLRIRFDQMDIIDKLVDDFLENPEWYIKHHNRYFDANKKYFKLFNDVANQYIDNTEFTQHEFLRRVLDEYRGNE